MVASKVTVGRLTHQFHLAENRNPNVRGGSTLPSPELPGTVPELSEPKTSRFSRLRTKAWRLQNACGGL